MIERYSNGRLEHVFKFTDEDGAALDISGSQFAIQLKNKHTKTVETVEPTLTKPGTAGWLKMEVSAADMATLLGDYVFDILEKVADGKIYHLHRDTLSVKAGETAGTWQ